VKDVALLKVKKTQGSRHALTSLDEVRGQPPQQHRPSVSWLIEAGDEIGSVEIDLAFADLVEDRLMAVAHQLPIYRNSIRKLAEKMTRKDFKACKEEFGTETSMSKNDKRIEIPGIPDTFTLPGANIIRGKLVFQK
jgi:hypothetical protein